MCRFLAYKGCDVVLADLVTNPSHSLIHQSYEAEERSGVLNGDGFGVGWYVPDISPEPCLFTSITPAWADENLRRIAEKTKSPCVFAHVRAATLGLAVEQLNCHPFQYKDLLWMHNGSIGSFPQMKRVLQQSLSDEAYHTIRGTTDSEHAFAIFVEEYLSAQSSHKNDDFMLEALKKTIARICSLATQEGLSESMTMNFAVTNGTQMLVSRFSSDSQTPAPSLYYCSGSRYVCDSGTCAIGSEGASTFVMIASEPLTRERDKWHMVPQSSIVSVSANLVVSQSKLQL